MTALKMRTTKMNGRAGRSPQNLPIAHRSQRDGWMSHLIPITTSS